MIIKEIVFPEKNIIQDVVLIHLNTFTGFFLTFMGKGFLKQMYKAYCEYDKAGLYVAMEHDQAVGFLAFSTDMSGLYKYMLKNKLIPFAWYSGLAVLRKPKAFMKLLRALLKPSESEREENYIRIASLGVKTESKSKGIGTMLINELIEKSDFEKYKYITLETDAIGNDSVNRFYQKNGFEIYRKFETHEGRKMNEYRWFK